MKRLLLVEDDVLYAIEVKMMLEKYFSQMDVIHATSAKKAGEQLESSHFNLLLLDVILEDESTSIDIAHRANHKKIPVIFMTSFQRVDLFTLAIQTKPYSYLQKPFSALELKQAIDLAILHAKENKFTLPEDTSKDSFILFKGQGKTYEKVPIEAIFLIKSDGNYCSFYTLEYRYLYRMALKNFRELITSEDFLRIHRNYVININFLDFVDTTNKSVQVAGQQYPLSRKYRAALLKKIKHKKDK